MEENKVKNNEKKKKKKTKNFALQGAIATVQITALSYGIESGKMAKDFMGRNNKMDLYLSLGMCAMMVVLFIYSTIVHMMVLRIK